MRKMFCRNNIDRASALLTYWLSLQTSYPDGTRRRLAIPRRLRRARPRRYCVAMPPTRDALASDTLSLEYQDLTDLRPLMSKLATMPRLTALNLNGNRLSSLPSDMSALRKLKTLDLTQNMFTSINVILPALKTLPVLTGAS